MKALRANNGRLTLARIDVPDAGSEALIRVTASGICNTDLEIVKGYSGFTGTVGHEFVGVVESCEDVPGLVGKRVVGEINAGCGTCPRCLTGDPRHCPERTVLGIVGRDGCHAEFTKLPSRNLLAVPDSISDVEAVFVEPLAAAAGISEQVRVEPETRVAVIGDGKLGLLCAITMKLSSDNVSIVGRHKEKMKIAGAVGVEQLFEKDAEKQQKSFDVMVEASGAPSGFAAAARMVRPRGTIVLKSTFHGSPEWPAAQIVVDEITVIGSRCGRFQPALDLLEDRKVNVLPLVSEEMTLDEGVRAVERASEKGVLKVVLRMDH